MSKNKFHLALTFGIIIFFLTSTYLLFSEKKSTPQNITFDSGESINKITETSSPLIFWSHFNRKVLNLPKYSGINAHIKLWDLIDKDTTQLWTIVKEGNDFVIRSCEKNGVLAINPKDSSIVLQLFEGKPTQLWNFMGKNDSIRIINKATRKYLAYINDRLRLIEHNNYKSQLWKIQTPQSFEKDKVTCNCVENFEFVKARVESSYPGFVDKINSTTKPSYDSLCNELVTKAKGTNKTTTCYSIISKYISFFCDKHLAFIPVFCNTSTVAPYKKPRQGAEYFNLYNVDDSTLLFSIPNFQADNKKIIDSLIKTNKNKLLKTPYLIIDLRNNGGGSDGSWQEIIPYIYTNPIKILGNDLLASDETISEYDELYHWDKRYQQQRKQLLDTLKKKTERLTLRYHDSYLKVDSVTPNPKRVAILINENCVSSGEAFLLSAKQSMKVILMGQPSSGVLDYSNVICVQCPSFAFKLVYPTTRAHWLPEYSVDREKIKPDIYLEYNQDWIKSAIKILKNKSN
jgi:hypothetical protein